MNSPRSIIVPVKYLAILIVAALAFELAGCQLVPIVAQALPEAAQYPGLKDQTVGIMVYADRGITIDHSSVNLDLASRIQNNLKEAEDVNTTEVKNTKWVSAEKIVRFQQDHPELEGEQMEKVALQLPALTRLIYVEITKLSLHPSEAIDLSLGSITVNIKVYQVDGDKTKSVYSENEISITYPQKTTPEGVTGLNDDDVYRESINEMGKKIASRFVQHEQDAE